MEPQEPIRAVVVDDEQLAREELCFLLGQIGAIEVVAQASNGLEALRMIEEEAPDLVMLDVQMPGLTGFEVARRLLRGGGDAQIVFVTAYDQYAIEAFEVNAVDYLLKPVEPSRLETTVDRVRRRIHSERPGAPAGGRARQGSAPAGGPSGPARAAGAQGRRPIPAHPGG